ncbi:transcription factor LHW isoform X2 [Dendrobium catenatum]|uniref:transcription factor LHW isoform X2 n=1 Tax=Dendrobium catenatum TaxID=906689 RepID=UPI0009F2E14C|nr:transcription factor LHW isoform X2 [Dendrobium catenatum]
MGLVLGDALRRLCVEIGWSYAVFWRAVGLQEQRYLIWEDGFCGRMHGGLSGFEAMDLLIKEKGLLRGSRCEERFAELGRPTEDRIYTLVHKRMTSQVHAVGDGVVGKAASTGNHQWILKGNLNPQYAATKDMVEINQQLLAGIQTIAVIPVLPQGVLQLGSTQMSGSMTRAPKPQLSASMQPSISQFGDISSNVSALLSNTFHDRDQLFRGHDSTFITKASSVCTSSLNKVSLPQQMLLDNNIGHVANSNLYPNNQLKSECLGHLGTSSACNSRITENALPYHSHSVYENHCQYADVNCSLFPGHLQSLENQYPADKHEAMADSSKVFHLRNHESKLSNSLKCSNSASSFGRENIGNTHTLSSGIMECIESQISSNSEVSQILSLADDLDRVHMLSCGFSRTQSTSTGEKSRTMCSVDKDKDGNVTYQALDGSMTEADGHGSGDGLNHSSNQDVWCDSCLVSANEQVPNSIIALANGQSNSTDILPLSSIKTTFDPQQQNSDSTLFDLFDFDQVSNANYSLSDNSFVNLNSVEVCELSTDVSTCIRQRDADRFGDILNDEISCSGGLFSESGSDQLLDAIVSQMKPTRKLISDDNVSCNTASTNISNNSLHSSSAQCNVVAISEQLHGKFVGQSPISPKSQIAVANFLNSECSIDRSEGVGSLGDDKFKSQISLWVGKARNMNCDGISAANCKRVDEVGKSNRKRSRTGENPRPRPKDRQMIQDRVKELREIVPNGAKMSIDALLEKTIKHMLFLQSVTKHADKLKETGKPKIISEDEGLLLKDNFDGGATWAFEVGSQSVICPIVVEDLSTPRHMLVEMLCEKRGLFLEIADLIRGLGLTILKGVMEARDDKVWARFAVEANRDVTRMDVFLSLVHLLEPTAGKAVLEGIRNCKKPHNVFNKPSIPVTGAADCL